MAGVVQKLIRRSSSLRTITTSFHNSSQPSKIAVPLLFKQPHVVDLKPDEPSIVNPILGFQDNGKSSLSPSLQQIYPSFPFGYCLNPISQSGVNQLEQVEQEVVESGEDTKTVWADSVKKKRKKKMNKHKYKKLRKRLRRQT